jgi:kynureninase
MLGTGIENIRMKSIKMTSYLIFLIDEILAKEPYNFKVGTPRDPNKRTGHVALEYEENAHQITEQLNQIRIAPVALYNSFHEIWQTVQIIKKIIDRKLY